MADHDGGLLPVVGLQQPLDEGAVLVGHPERLFGVVRLHHVRPFDEAFQNRNTVLTKPTLNSKVNACVVP